MNDDEVIISDAPRPRARYKYRPRRIGSATSDPSKAMSTNDIFSLVTTSFLGGDARRWKDLMVHYIEKVGMERMRDEVVRAKVLSIVNLTIELERQTDGCVAGNRGRLLRKYRAPDGHQVVEYRQGDPESIITVINTITTLQKQLGLE